MIKLNVLKMFTQLFNSLNSLRESQYRFSRSLRANFPVFTPIPSSLSFKPVNFRPAIKRTHTRITEVLYGEISPLTSARFASQENNSFSRDLCRRVAFKGFSLFLEPFGNERLWCQSNASFFPRRLTFNLNNRFFSARFSARFKPGDVGAIVPQTGLKFGFFKVVCSGLMKFSLRFRI